MAGGVGGVNRNSRGHLSHTYWKQAAWPPSHSSVTLWLCFSGPSPSKPLWHQVIMEVNDQKDDLYLGSVIQWDHVIFLKITMAFIKKIFSSFPLVKVVVVERTRTQPPQSWQFQSYRKKLLLFSVLLSPYIQGFSLVRQVNNILFQNCLPSDLFNDILDR